MLLIMTFFNDRKQEKESQMLYRIVVMYLQILLLKEPFEWADFSVKFVANAT